MNNEETILNENLNIPSSQYEQENKKQGVGKGTVIGAAVAGAVMGAAGTTGAMAAAGMFDKGEEVEETAQNNAEEVVASQEPVVAQAAPQTVDVHTTVHHVHHHVVETAEESVPEVNSDDELIAKIDEPIEEEPEPVIINTSYEEEPEIEILGVAHLTDDYGDEYALGAMTVDGTLVELADLNNDGTFDAAGIDYNGNNVIEPELDEVVDISDQGLQVSDMEDAYLAQQAQQLDIPEEIEIGMPNPDVYTATNEDMPDYVNDADILV